jgi:serine/threonine-protein phosphatase 2A regulatory subunit A
MFAAAYPGMGAEAQGEMRTMFTALCNDDTPMVRRAAAKALGVGHLCPLVIEVANS